MVEVSNFIYQKSGGLSLDDCDALIKDGITMCQHQNIAQKGKDQFSLGSLGRDDVQLDVPRCLGQWHEKVTQVAFGALSEYSDHVSTCNQVTLVSPTFKWQWVPVGGGYSVWHIEQGAGLSSNRCLAWMIYLNDVDNGGETEFLYQHQRVIPEAGKVVIWPAGVTHPHRGNPPYSNEKFLCTGWFEVASNDVYDQAINALKKQGKNE